jgi:hypothetical protein
MSGPGVDALLAQMRAQREQWVELAPGLRVKLRRPHEFAVARMRGGIEVDHLVEHVVDWDGFTGETLLGRGVGTSAPVAFEPRLWREAISDHREWAATLTDAMLAAVKDHFDRKEAAAKN